VEDRISELEDEVGMTEKMGEEIEKRIKKYERNM
jgi:hypothetical protein